MGFRQGLAIGSIIGGDYRVLDVLGQGGFGLTYKGFDTRLGAAVAIKEYFPADLALREDGTSVRVRSSREEGVFAWGREKFLDEAKTLAKFRHNNIVRVARLFEENNTAYMVLDFEEGPSLAQWRDDLGRAPRQDEIDHIAMLLLEAVDVVHRGGILHRDIKPQNVIMRGGNEPVLIDFGAARASLGARSKTVHAIVTPGYSPKEQYALDVDKQGPWSDIYALGATLYFLVTGRSPPDALTRDLQDHMPMETDGREPYRDQFIEAIDAAMSVRSEDRPQSIPEWRRQLFTDAQTHTPGRNQRGVEAATVLAPPQTRRPAATRPATARAGTVRPGSARQTPQGLPNERDLPPSGSRNVSFDQLQSAQVPPAQSRSTSAPVIGGVLGALAVAAAIGFYSFIIVPGQDEAAWQAARSADTVTAYEAYLSRRPNGRYAPDARDRRQRLAATQVPAPEPKTAPPPVLQPFPKPIDTQPPLPLAPPLPQVPLPQGPQAKPSDPPPVPPPTTPTDQPPAGRGPGRVALPPRTLPGPLSPAELQQIQRSVTAARFRLVSFPLARSPGWSSQGTDFTAELERLSAGRIALTATDPQEIGGSTRMLSAIMSNTDLIGWHAPILSQARRKAFTILHGAVPFGLGPADHVRWMRADGARLLEQTYSRDNYHFRAIPCGIAGAPGGWFKREIRSPSDFRGLKFRAVGLASDVLQRLGGEGSGTQTAGLAAEFVANRVDAALFNTTLLATFAQTPPPAAVYHFPSWHAPTYTFDLLIGSHHWNSMTTEQQKLIDEACRLNLDRWATQFESSQTEALTQIRNARILVRPFTGPTLEALRKATDEVLAEEAARSAEFKEVLDSYDRFRRR